MLDFFIISIRNTKNGVKEIYPKFIANESDDLMIRGNDFYAIWDEESGMWTTNRYNAIKLIDRELDKFAEEQRKQHPEDIYRVLHLWDTDTGIVDKWKKFCTKQIDDNYLPLDENLVFANTPVKKENYASRKLDYPLEKGPIKAYEELVDVLYSKEERHKIEWVIGSIVSGQSKNIQKFMVMYGSAGTGKSTIINIIQKLFEGYWSAFDAKALGSASNVFALESFKNDPLVAIQHDGDLSKIEDNTRLNSVISHEFMTVNEKFKSTYEKKFNAFLIIGTNKPVKITDAKSGIIRRLIDVSPTGDKVPNKKYMKLIHDIDFELGAIAYHCLQVYLDDPGYYDSYIPVNMIGATNDFYNFVFDNYDVFAKDDMTTLNTAWAMYDAYCQDSKLMYQSNKRVFKEELKNYFEDFKERGYLEDGSRARNVYSGFLKSKFEYELGTHTPEPEENWLTFNSTISNLDVYCSDCPAQYANDEEKPKMPWSKVDATLSELNTKKLHYVRVPENLIVIDFDIRGEDGKKSFEENLKAASEWPETYAELSKSGAGIHLHYIYQGDPTQLSRVYADNVEIKVFTGKSSLRRKVTKCNDIPITMISTGLPLRKEKAGKVINIKAIESEKELRRRIVKCLKKEYDGIPSTKSNCDFIYKMLQDAYESGMVYDITDMKPAILEFAYNSTNQYENCVKLVMKMKFKSETVLENDMVYTKDKPAFYDVEVFKNLFIVCWKYLGTDEVVTMINPTKDEVSRLFDLKLVGFNNRKYDNHILWARSLGYSEYELYQLSQDIIVRGTGHFGSAYNASYTDIYDYASKKQSLKKWEIELGIHHQELPIPWDQEVPKDRWEEVAGYCRNDVRATERVWEATQGDFLAREILAELTGSTVNDTTNQLTTKLIFGKDKNPQLVYTNLTTGESFDAFDNLIEKNPINAWPEYNYIPVYESPDRTAHNVLDGIDLGFGGYVYANPGMYYDVVTFDVSSMHPNSIRMLNLFGEYTQNFVDILDARLAIKHKDFEKAGKLFGGKLKKFLTDPSTAKQLAQALKIAINSVYGLTSAKFDNPFRDKRNINNIVALRGALFMASLQKEVESRGYIVAHIKTDSIKIVNPDKDIIDFVMSYGERYGYSFEVEHKFEKICLVNNAVYIAKLSEDDPEDPGKWTATGTQFQIPYLFKSLFSKEPIEFRDMCETKEVKTALYLDMNENLHEDEHNYTFVGKVGSFCPMKPGTGGGLLMREKDGKYSYATGAKGYRWMEAEAVKNLGKEDDIDTSYFNALIDDAIDEINKYGDFYEFVS